MTDEWRDTTSGCERVERPSQAFGRGGEADGQMTDEWRDTTSGCERVERPSQRRVIAAWAWLSGLCLIVAGCAPSDEAPPAGGTNQGLPPASASQAPGQGLAIEFRSEPDPPEAGANTFEVTVKQPDGSPLADATVTIVFSMPAMPSMNMPAMRSTTTLAHQSAGRYRGTGQLSMGGTWNVTVTVSRGGEALGGRKLSVIAK
jgi:hypothetical protein